MNNSSPIVIRRLGLALAVSFLFHFLVFARFGIFSSSQVSRLHGPLQVSMRATMSEATPALAPQVATASPATPPAPAAKPREPAVRLRPPTTRKAPDAAPPMLAANPAAMAKIEIPRGLPFSGQAEALRRVETGFETYSGAERKLVGSGRQIYVSDKDENYGISTQQSQQSQPSGPADARGAAQGTAHWRLEISGRITRDGLSPLLYDTQGDLAERLVALQGGAPSAAPASASRKGRFRDGLLDRQSLLYQFMLRPPNPLGGELWLTDGARNEVYEYRFGGLETLSIAALGELRSVRLVLSGRESGETIELWLVPELRYLAVRARYTDRTGAVIEQVATSLEYK